MSGPVKASVSADRPLVQITLAPHPTIDASTRGRGRIAHRSAELGYGRTAADLVWITDEQRPLMRAKASPNHKLNSP